MSEPRNLPCVDVVLNYNKKDMTYITGVRHVLADIIDYIESQEVADNNLDYFREQFAIVEEYKNKILER